MDRLVLRPIERRKDNAMGSKWNSDEPVDGMMISV